MKKPLLFSPVGEFEEQTLQSLRDGENGAEWDILERLVLVVLSGEKIDPVFQSVVNAIVAKAVISGKLPYRSRGRPADLLGGVSGWSVAERYLELRDSGLLYRDAVAGVAAEFHKDERHIMRLVKESRSGVEFRMGGTAEERNLFRERSKRRDEAKLSADDDECVASVLAMADAQQADLEKHFQNEAQRDYLADLAGLIGQALGQKKSTDIN